MRKKSLAPSGGVTHREDKGNKFMSIVEAAYDKAHLANEEAQRVNEAPGLPEVIADFIANNRVSNKFKGEEVPSEYGYFSCYEKPSLAEQCSCLRGMFFGGLGFANMDLVGQIQKGEVPLPQGAEDWFAVPNPKIFQTYCVAVREILDRIRQTRNRRFCNFHEGEIKEEHLRQSERSKKFWEKLSEAQGNPNILVVPAQFGLRHRGRSVRRAREVFLGNEFGLGAFAVGSMLLTHAKRLHNYDDLWADCAGDEWSPLADGVFSKSPFFKFCDDKVEFDTDDVSYASGHCGSASGFGPL